LRDLRFHAGGFEPARYVSHINAKLNAADFPFTVNKTSDMVDGYLSHLTSSLNPFCWHSSWVHLTIKLVRKEAFRSMPKKLMFLTLNSRQSGFRKQRRAFCSNKLANGVPAAIGPAEKEQST
jgi:hypothetical protein